MAEVNKLGRLSAEQMKQKVLWDTPEQVVAALLTNQDNMIDMLQAMASGDNAKRDAAAAKLKKIDLTV